jgi:circadian clock protein KaiC
MRPIPKSKTGIEGLDEITEGGLPQGRPTLICGGPGCGKTLLAIEFLVKGATLYNEPGVFMAFEEKTEELTANVASLGFDLEKMQKNRKFRMDYVHIDKSEIDETGEYDLNGLFIRLGHAIDNISAKRVVLDTIENLFAGLTNQGILRAELRRLFQWLKDKDVTAIITAEKGEGMLTRHGLEEYVSDCVILLDHRIVSQISTRRLRIIKYRGSIHGTNEYPFLIDEEGITVLPVTSLKLDKNVSSQRVSSGISSLDLMFGGKGFFRGSSILISGTSGTGKTSIASFFANATCTRKEKCIYFAFEESPQQIIRNMRSIGLNLDQHVKKGLLEFHSFRPGLYGLEMHLASMYKLIKKFKPRAVILDPITNLVTVGLLNEVNSMLLRLIDHMQNEGITLMLTALNSGITEHIDENVSSLVDTWILVKDVESNGERNRALYIMKSRGMKHSKEVREFVMSSQGLNLVEVYRGPEGILIGSAREAKEREALSVAKQNGRGHFKQTSQKIKK